jgi:hypothetical protein
VICMLRDKDVSEGGLRRDYWRRRGTVQAWTMSSRTSNDARGPKDVVQQAWEWWEGIYMCPGVVHVPDSGTAI